MRVGTIRRPMIGLAVLMAGLLPLFGNAARAERVTVFAAASLQDVLHEAADDWSGDTGHQVVIVPAGSSTLARQIQQGAPADLFISANVAWMDVLAKDGLIVPDSRIDLAGNRLALISADRKFGKMEIGAGLDLSGLLGGERLAMALVEAVPAGIYGKAALKSLGLWAGVRDRVAETDNVRAALVLVQAQEARFGIVYATDARSADVATLGLFPSDSHPKIVYPAARMRESRSAAADLFLTYLQGPKAQGIFADHGFGAVN